MLFVYYCVNHMPHLFYNAMAMHVWCPDFLTLAFFRLMKRFKVWKNPQYCEPWKIIYTSVQASCRRRWSDVWQLYIAGFVVQCFQVPTKTSHLYCQGHQLMLYFLDVVPETTRISLARLILKYLGYQLIRTNFLEHLMPLVTTGWFIIDTYIYKYTKRK